MTTPILLTNEQSEHSAVGTAHHYFTCHQLEQTLGSRIICQPGYSYVWHLSWRPKLLYSFLLPSPRSPLLFPTASQGLSGRRQNLSIFMTWLAWEVTQHCLCPILFLTCKTLKPTHFQRVKF